MQSLKAARDTVILTIVLTWHPISHEYTQYINCPSENLLQAFDLSLVYTPKE